MLRTRTLLAFVFLSTLRAQAPEFTSGSMADATEKLTGHPAHMSSEIRLLTGVRLIGPAVTLGLVRDEKKASFADALATIKLLESAPEGSVVVIALDQEKSFAVVGSTFTALAKARKLAGFVVDGSVRDLPELQRLELPILARGTAPGSAGGHYRVAVVNGPVQCGGMEVRPGDYVVADGDGVTVVPKERYEQATIAAAKVQSEKQELLRLLDETGSYTKALREKYAADRRP